MTIEKKISGIESWMNMETGEIKEFVVEEIKSKNVDFGWNKVWLGTLIETLDIVGNKKMKVVNHLMKKKDQNNLVIGTYRKIAEESGVSLDLVRRTMRALMKANFISKVQNGLHRLNPCVVFKGNSNQRRDIILKFSMEQNKNIATTDTTNSEEKPKNKVNSRAIQKTKKEEKKKKEQKTSSFAVSPF